MEAQTYFMWAMLFLFLGFQVLVDPTYCQGLWDSWAEELEALCLQVFNAVMFIAIAIYCTTGICSALYAGLLPLLRAVGVGLRTMTDLASEHSKAGMRGVARLAVNKARVALRGTSVSRFYTRLMLGDEVAIVALLVLPAAFYYAKVNLGDPVFAYILGFVGGMVTSADVDLEGCSYSALIMKPYEQNPRLGYYCEGSYDGYAALVWWKESHEEIISTWEFYQPVVFYSVVTLFCLFVMTVFVTTERPRAVASTQTESTGDLKGLTEQVAQLLAKIRNLEGCKAFAESTAEELKERFQQQSSEVQLLRRDNLRLQAVSDENISNQLQLELEQEREIITLLRQGYQAFKQLAGTFVERGLGFHLLRFTRELESQCEAIAPAGAKSLKTAVTLSDRMQDLLDDAAINVARLRVSKPEGRHPVKQDVKRLRRKLRTCKRQQRFVETRLATQVVEAGLEKEANLASRVTLIKELDSYRKTTIELRRELSEKEQAFMLLGSELERSRAQSTVAEQGFAEAVKGGEAVLQELREQLSSCLQREVSLQEEVARKDAELNQRVDALLGDANQRVAEEGQQRLRRELEDLTEEISRQVDKQMSEKNQELANLRAEYTSLVFECRKVEAEKAQVEEDKNKAEAEKRQAEQETKQLAKKHAQERKEAGSARENAVALLNVQLVEQRSTISDLQQKLCDANEALSASVDLITKQQIEELGAQIKGLEERERSLSGTEITLRRENQELRERMSQIERQQSSKKAVGSVFADPAKARANKLQKDVQNLRQEAEVMAQIRDRLAEEVRQLKAKHESGKDSHEPETPLTIPGFQLLQREERTQ